MKEKNNNIVLIKSIVTQIILLVTVTSLSLEKVVFAQLADEVNQIQPDETSTLLIDTTNQVKLKASLTPPYILGPGDQITIIDRTLKDLFGQVERYDLVISSDGYISIPLPDGSQQNILSAGSTLDELSNEVRNLFAQTLKRPLVFLQVSKYRPINVYLGGAVVKPGIYKVETTSSQEGGKTTASTINTFGLSLTQVIQLAGGLKARADIKNITVTRGTSSTKKTIDLNDIITSSNTSQDINLQPGDAVYVPFTDNVEDQAQTHVLLLGKLAYQEIPVSVVGEVKKSGNLVLSNDSTIIDAIGAAGGTNEVGTLKKVRLSRFDPDGIYRTRDINIHDILHGGTSYNDITLRPNDSLEFLPSKGKEVRHFFHSIANVLVSSVSSSIASYILQDNLLDRMKRGAGGISSTSAGSSNIPPITIFTTTTTSGSE